MGRPHDAVRAFLRAIETEPRESTNYPVDVGNLGVRCFIPLGRLRDAEERIGERIRSARRLSKHSTEGAHTENDDAGAFSRNNEAIGHSDLGYLCGLCGYRRRSGEEFRKAERMFNDDAQSLGIVNRLRAELAILAEDRALARRFVRAAEGAHGAG